MARTVRVAAALALALVFVSFVGAQVRTEGDIRGTVFDPSGVVTPNANISLKDTETEISRTTRSAKTAHSFFSIRNRASITSL